MRQVSKKEAVNKINLKKVYWEIDNEREPICEGCGSSQMLSHSHLIARSKRKDLESDKRNIRLHCQDLCHPRWESMVYEEMAKMNDFEENMEYIREVDEKHYNYIMSKKVNDEDNDEYKYIYISNI